MTEPMKEKIVMLEGAPDEECERQVKEILRELADQDITCALFIVQTPTHLASGVIGKHHEIERMIYEALGDSEKNVADEMERLDHYMAVALISYTQAKQARRKSQ